jgi:ABC-type phosphate transport system substrate-binding protein
VVVNERNPVNGVTQAELRKILAGQRRTWPGGIPVKVIARAPGTRERAALLKVLAMSESDYHRYWTVQVFRGEAQAEPVVVPSNGMQKEAIRAFPGAITLMGIQDVKVGMKVLRVDGHGPGDEGYPLR